jgi:hypothetical protein
LRGWSLSFSTTWKDLTLPTIHGEYSLVGLIDLFFMTGLTTWVDDVKKLDELLPPESGWRRWLGRYIMKAL